MKKILIIGGMIILLVAGAVSPSIGASKKPVRITPADVAQAIDLKQREETVLSKEGELLKREQEMAEVRSEVDQKLARLVNLQKQIKEQLDKLRPIFLNEIQPAIKSYKSSFIVGEAEKLANKIQGIGEKYHEKTLVDYGLKLRGYIEDYLSLKTSQFFQKNKDEILEKERNCDNSLAQIEKILYGKIISK